MGVQQYASWAIRTITEEYPAIKLKDMCICPHRHMHSVRLAGADADYRLVEIPFFKTVCR